MRTEPKFYGRMKPETFSSKKFTLKKPRTLNFMDRKSKMKLFPHKQ